MATYAAYRHVELDKIGQGKKRVLKPPGGGSSISFMDDEPTSKNSSQSSLKQVIPESPVEIREKASPLPDKESTSSTPSSETKNGMHNAEKLHSSENSPLLKENIPPVLSEKEFESKLNVSVNDRKTNDEFETVTQAQSPDDKSDAKPKSVNGVNGVHVASPHERESNLLNGNSVFEKVDSSYMTTKLTSYLAQNGSSSPTCLSPTNSSYGASQSMKRNQDTQERVIGHTVEALTLTPPSSEQTRKIKDHMRSSILMSDEDYTPTRSSRFNATVNDTHPENLPSAGAGQRQRIPPGGYSTKLW